MASSSKSSQRDWIEYGDSYRKRALAHATKASKGSKSDWKGPGDGFLIVAFFVRVGEVEVPIEATSDHVLSYFLKCGLSLGDFGPGGRVGNAVEIAINAYDVFVWLLDLRFIELCGQRVGIRLDRCSVTEALFRSSIRRNQNGLEESQFLANEEAVRTYKWRKEKKKGRGKFEANESKVLIWGESYGEIPTLWNGSNGRTVIQASCGEHHVAFLTDTGQVITTGESLQGQTGSGPSSSHVDSYAVKMPANVAVTQIACGNTYTLCLTETNNVYYFGTCKFAVPHGPYNVPKQTTLFKVNLPTLWEDLKRFTIVQIASGAAHMLFLRSDTKVMSVGAPGNGRLGRNTLVQSPTTPHVIPALSDIPITKISCGYANSIAYATNVAGAVYVWGMNDKYQCGLDEVREVLEPVLLAGFDKITIRDIACGRDKSYAITDQGTYHWGSIRNHPSMPNSLPVPMDCKAPMVKIAVGWRHALGLGPNGEVYSWGSSALGQCGHGDSFTYNLPTRIHGLPSGVAGISACGALSIAFTGFLRTPLSDSIEKCFNNPDSFPDLIFKIKGTDVYAHRAMLVARCPQLSFLPLLLGQDLTTPLNSTQIDYQNVKRNVWPAGTIPNESPAQLPDPVVIEYENTFSKNKSTTLDALLFVLKYIYTDVISTTPETNLEAVLAIVEDFGIPRLKQLLSAPTSGSSRLASSFSQDLDLLIQTPDDYEPTAKDARFLKEKKTHLPNLVGAFADLSIIASESNVTIPVHRFLMFCRSDFFATLLNGSMLEAKTRIVSLDTDESTCRWLLRFLYTDQTCTTDINVTVELLKLGAMIQQHRLVFLCSRSIEKALDLETTVYMYHLTSTHSITALRDICWDIIIQNFDAVKQTDYWVNNLTTEEMDAWIRQYRHPTPASAKN